MNRCSIFTACLALVSLFTPDVVNAEVSLAADLVAGVESSSATPVGRVSQGVLMVAKTATGETNLLIAREPSGSIASITTLTKTSGVVAYAGSELKGYGNLVLIRHPNGYVSAYAHNGAVAVKRGETVKRGQTIAKSGQSGNVASPQLHFELRKGSTPVDPTGYLAGL